MKLVRCKKCKKMYEFISIDNNYCPDCLNKEYERYLAVRAYIKNNPGITVRQVSDDLNVRVPLVMKYLKEEKLEILPTSNSFLKCQNCGAEIITGVYCDNCKRTLNVSSPAVFVANNTKDSSIMFTARKGNK